jgi:hypothetical protein
MKRRNIVYSLCVLLALVLLFVIVKPQSKTANCYQRKFLENSDFLTDINENTSALGYYYQAVRIIQDSNMVDSNQPLELKLIDKEKVEKVCSLLISGAKKKQLGSYQIGMYQTLFVVPNYGELEILEIMSIAKVVEQFARDIIEHGIDVERALYLGKTCVAVGIQFSDNDLQLVRLLGIVFKEKGHAILKAYAEATGKEECLELAAQIRKEIDKEII